jgi:hypothetical protein
MSGAETIRIEEYTGIIQSKLVAVWQPPDAIQPWLPSEFLLSQYITRILIAGRVSPISTALAADPSWTQIWRSPGGKEWSCLLGILQHMPGPVLIVIAPDMVLNQKLVSNLQAVRTSGTTTVLVLRQPGIPQAGWVGDAPDQVFFPIIEAGALTGRHAGLWAAAQEWSGRAVPRGIDIKGLLPQLAAQGYALTVTDGAWHWYKPSDSAPMTTLSVAQIARQLHIMGTLLEKAAL